MVAPFQVDDACVGVDVPPPRTYKPIQGAASEIRIVERDYRRLAGDTRARSNGLRFEWRVQTALIERFGADYLPSPGVYFTDDSGLRVCIPDGILRYVDHITIIEIKAQHVPDAWWQTKLYEEVLGRKYYMKPVSTVEIVRSFDPFTPFPCPVERLYSLDDIMRHKSGFGVYEWPK